MVQLSLQTSIDTCTIFDPKLYDSNTKHSTVFSCSAIHSVFYTIVTLSTFSKILQYKVS